LKNEGILLLKKDMDWVELKNKKKEELLQDD